VEANEVTSTRGDGTTLLFFAYSDIASVNSASAESAAGDITLNYATVLPTVTLNM
jgi:hypothetical protein